MGANNVHFQRADRMYKEIKFRHQTNSLDLCLLTLCQHSIISIGTFGWWSAYLRSPKNTFVFRVTVNEHSKENRSQHYRVEVKALQTPRRASIDVQPGTGMNSVRVNAEQRGITVYPAAVCRANSVYQRMYCSRAADHFTPAPLWTAFSAADIRRWS